MSSNLKYHHKITQENETWSANIIRKVSQKRTQVTMSQKGFPSEAEAIEWSTNAIQTLLKKQYDKQKLKNKESTNKTDNDH